MSNPGLEYGNGKKLGTNFDYVPENKQIGVSAGVRSFWTNFEKATANGSFEIVNKPVAGYWEFKTNIPWEDLETNWEPNRVKRFLHQMWEIYRYRKAN